MQRYHRTIPEVWEHLKHAARLEVYPFTFTTFEDNEQVMKSLSDFSTLDHDKWAEAYSALAGPVEERARRAEEYGDVEEAKRHYMHAYGLYRMGRFPAPLTEGKIASYRKAQEMFLCAARYIPYPIERVQIPFQGKPGEGQKVIGYFRQPDGWKPSPLVLIWAGIDSYKEDDVTELCETFLKANVATLCVDIPGTGDAPLHGSEDAERMWDAIFSWIDSRSDLDASRVAGWGLSTGGYWATKVAHTHRERFAAVVNHGGAVHYAFTEEWLEKAQFGHYPFNIIDTLSAAFGDKPFHEFLEYAPSLSLLHQGVLDFPCAPMLLVNGVGDSVFPIRDMYLLLEHGSCKSARFYPGEHMGLTSADVMPMIQKWILDKLQ